MKLLNINGTSIDLEQIQIAHFIPGRIRLRTPQLKNNPAMAKSIQKSITEIPFLLNTEFNLKTGGILVTYDQSRYQELLDWIQNLASSGILPEDLTLDDIYKMASNHSNNSIPSMSDEISTFFRGLNNRFKKSTGGFLGINDAFPLMLFSLGLKRLLASERLAFPDWYTYMWFAFTSYFILNPRKPDSDKNVTGN